MTDNFIPAIPKAYEDTPTVTARTVHAGNLPTDHRSAGLYYLFGFLAWAASVGAYWFLTNWPRVLVFIVGFPLLLAMFFVILLIANGEFPAWSQIRHDARNERLRIQATERAHHREMVIQLRAENNRHEERMLELENVTIDRRLHDRVALLTDQVHRLGAGNVKPESETFVPAAPSPALVAIRAWLAEVYDNDGVNEDHVYSSNRMLKRAAPWNSIWKGEEWAQEARTILMRDNVGILQQVPNSKNVALRYPTQGTACRHLPATTGGRAG